MSIPGGGSPLLLGGGPQQYKIERSIRLNASDSAYLSRTPASAGNRKTWTWAGWVKRSALSATQVFYSAATDGNNRCWFAFSGDFYNGTNGDKFYISQQVGGVYSDLFVSSGVFRDPSAWYHIVVALDTSQASNTNRLKIYVNGSQIDGTLATITQNADLQWNTNNGHSLGRSENTAGFYFSGYLADIHFIDGQALTPSSFAETKATTGQWVPKAYTGSYGTNGFQLKFVDNSNNTATTLGKDTSGNGNNWTPNNLTAGPATTSNSWSGYFDGGGDYLSLASGFTLGTGNFTVEAWVKTSTTSQKAEIWQNNGSLGSFVVSTNFNAADAGTILGTTTPPGFGWSVLFASSATLPANKWNHIAWVRSSGVITVYINGTASGAVSSSTNSLSLSRIGAWPDPNYDLEGYISNLRVVVGTAVYTSSFSVPTAPLTAITNTSLLTLQNNTFIDNSSNAYSITATGNTRVSYESPFEESVDTDSLVDTPTSYGTDTGAGGEVRGNYATLNPLIATSSTLSNGNLDYASTATYQSAFSTIGVRTGKWYFEGTVGTFATDAVIGVGYAPFITSTYVGGSSTSWGYEGAVGRIYNNGSFSAFGNTFGPGDVIGVAFDADTGKLWFAKNGTWQASGDPATGANPALTLTTGIDYFFGVSAGSTGTWVCNYGARPFAYPAPAGFKALCDTNLPAPVVAKPNTAFDVALWTGNGSARSITGLNFNPDFVWIKGRSGATDHALYDVVRGTEKRLESNTTDAEVTSDGGVTAFNSDGFSLGTLAQVNTNSSTYVAWTWDAGSSTVTNTQGSITSQVRTNGYLSIVSYTGTGTTATVGHGLGVTPALIIVKDRDSTPDWVVYHQSLGTSSDFLYFNQTAAKQTVSGYWGTPSSTTFGVLGGTYAHNRNGEKTIAYCFAPVAGYSSFGSYTGNGSSTDGPFVFTGMRPRWIMLKRTDSTGNWTIIDTAREGYNVDNDPLYPNLSDAEGTADLADILSNGFKLRSTDTSVNASAGTYVYACFAEAPFALARAR